MTNKPLGGKSGSYSSLIDKNFFELREKVLNTIKLQNKINKINQKN